jgi:hypothetical protein
LSNLMELNCRYNIIAYFGTKENSADDVKKFFKFKKEIKEILNEQLIIDLDTVSVIFSFIGPSYQ